MVCIFRLRQIKRGDIITFDFTERTDAKSLTKTYVKRIAAVPGDTLLMTKSGAFLKITTPNGNAYREINDWRLAKKYSFTLDSMVRIIIPGEGTKVKLNSGNIFLFRNLLENEGSKIELSNDKVYIDGELTLRYRINENCYFVLGDNIQNSRDSREIGLIPESNIIGKPLFVYWSVFDNNIRFDRIGKWVK